MSAIGAAVVARPLPCFYRPTGSPPSTSWFSRYRLKSICGAAVLLILVSAGILRPLRLSDIIHCSWLPGGCHALTRAALASHSREAYVTFLSATTDPGYIDSVRLLNFALKHDPLTRDPFERDFVVMTTEYTDPAVERILEDEGAIIRRVPLVLGLPGDLEEEKGNRYRDVYTKLQAWNLVAYERVLFIDGDILLVKPILAVWSDKNSRPPSGLAALSDLGGPVQVSPIPDGPYLNSGFMMLQPSEHRFKELIQVTDFDPLYPDQALINKFFSQDGPHPWAPMNHIYSSIHPSKEDLFAGVHSLHEKLWKQGVEHDWLDREMTEVWRERFGRMEGYYLHDRLSRSMH